MNHDIQISLLGRNEIVREGLRRILIEERFRILSSVDDSCHLSDLPTDPMGNGSHIIIIDTGPDNFGLEQCRELRQRFPDSYIVLLADSFKYEEVAEAFRSGVDGYIVKEISCDPLISSLHLVSLGEKVMPSQLAGAFANGGATFKRSDWRASITDINLSEREVEILRSLILGYANKVISRRLEISEATVKVHVKAILRKLRVSNRTQAAIWAVKHGLEAHLAAQPKDKTILNDDDGVRPILTECAA
ncbi:LuxR C-terminal-related transcriptional regulator [Rhizorhapis sp. SPR117]|uniref:LuxR C-terminal-related transcriptional regulator n=1 Tax=Rhizorhapis sp. SPR117 TaxID=2912611 RepID=UPI001F30E2FA|nr:response regulator transcription factor [Rhizorhapis sp. SPR117]